MILHFEFGYFTLQIVVNSLNEVVNVGICEIIDRYEKLTHFCVSPQNKMSTEWLSCPNVVNAFVAVKFQLITIEAIINTYIRNRLLIVIFLSKIWASINFRFFRRTNLKCDESLKIISKWNKNEIKIQTIEMMNYAMHVIIWT